MNKTPSGLLGREGLAALAHMEKALALIDQCDDAADVGAHLDLDTAVAPGLALPDGVEIAPRRPFYS